MLATDGCISGRCRSRWSILARLLAVLGLVASSFQTALARPFEPSSGLSPAVQWVVNSTADSGAGSLRQAMLAADAGDTITFDPAVFPPGSPASILLTSALPALTLGGITLDASNAGVILDGSLTPGGTIGLQLVGAGGYTIQGLSLLNFKGQGIYIASDQNIIGGSRLVGSGPLGEGNRIGASWGNGLEVRNAANNQVLGNVIGVTADGVSKLSNSDGIALSAASYTQIGSSLEGQGNLVSGNGGNGIAIYNGSHHNTILGNQIGVDATGMQAVNNTFSGILIWGASHHNQIGGPASGERNIISGNGWHGVSLEGVGTDYNRVLGNYIGTDREGVRPLGNQKQGTPISQGASYNEIGGPAAGEGNIITYNRQPGVIVLDNGSDHNLVQGNRIGLDADGTGGLDPRHLVVADDGTLFLADGGRGVFRSDDNANLWTAASSGLDPLQISLLAVAPGFATARQAWAWGGDGLFVSSDAGDTWSLLSRDLAGQPLRDLKVSPNFAADALLLAASETHGIYKSGDGGATWTPVYTGSVDSLAFSPNFASDHLVLAGLKWNATNGVLRSVDGGQHWDFSNAGLPENGVDVVDLAFAPDAQSVFLATSSARCNSGAVVYRSMDAGRSWAASGSNITDCGPEWKLAVSPDYANDQTVLVVEDQIFRSTDGGASWNWSGSGAFGSRGYALALSPAFATDQRAYDVSFAGVFQSSDGGVNWQWAAANLADPGNGSQGLWLTGDAGLTRIISNVIGANAGNGILIDSLRAEGSLVSGNLIGLAADGVTRAANGSTNIRLNTPYVTVLNNTSAAGSHGGLRTGPNGHHETIRGNRFGTDQSGTRAVGNSYDGLTLDSAWNTLQDNLISGNLGDGLVGQEGMTHTLLIGNRIGVNYSGTLGLANRYAGIRLEDSYDNTIGGSQPGEGNLISGNGEHGIVLSAAYSNTVPGNVIGLAADGTRALGNAWCGVAIMDASQDNTIGGEAPGQGNLLSGNQECGVWVSASSRNRISGNWVGTTPGGTLDLGNGFFGVALTNRAWLNQVRQNTIAYNVENGIYVAGLPGAQSPGTISNTLSQNSIYSNLRKGIRLRYNGNQALPAPQITAAGAGSLQGTTCPGCTVEVFSDLVDQGRVYEGNVTAQAGGQWTFTGTLTGPRFTATATDAAGNTSEFSAPYPPLAADFSAAPTAGLAPLTVVFTNTSSSGYTASQWAFGDGKAGTQVNPQHVYTLPGAYTVTLTVTYPSATEMVTRTSLIRVYRPVTAGFTIWPVSGQAPLVVSFTNTTRGDYTASLWDFGDGLKSEAENPTHTFTLAGSYTVTLTADGPGGTSRFVQPAAVTVTQVAAVVTPGAAVTAVFSTTAGVATRLALPAQAVTTTTRLVYTPLAGVTPPVGYAFAGQAFDLQAFQGSTVLPDFHFQAPVTLTLHYRSQDVSGQDETRLVIQYFDEAASAWRDVAATCTPPGHYIRDLVGRSLSVPICHLSRYALFAATQANLRTYLPFLRRQ